MRRGTSKTIQQPSFILFPTSTQQMSMNFMLVVFELPCEASFVPSMPGLLLICLSVTPVQSGLNADWRTSFESASIMRLKCPRHIRQAFLSSTPLLASLFTAVTPLSYVVISVLCASILFIFLSLQFLHIILGLQLISIITSAHELCPNRAVESSSTHHVQSRPPSIFTASAAATSFYVREARLWSRLRRSAALFSSSDTIT